MKQIGMENWKSTNCDIFLRLNDNFEKLYLPNLKSFPTEVSIEIFGSFCLSVEEISNFYSSPNVTLKNVPDQFCPFSNISIIQEERIYQENYPTIQLLKNQNLENVKFPKLHIAQLSYSVGIPIEFSLNHESLSKNPKICSEIMHQINTTDINFLLIDRKNCETIQKEFAKNYLVIDADSNLTEKELIPTFKNVKTIFGTIIISRTNLTSLKFLAGLESLECDDIPSDPDLNNPKNGLKLYKNFEMTEIGMINWTNTSCSVQIEMYANFSNFNVPNLKNFNSSDPNKNEIYIQYNYYGKSEDYVCFSLEETSNFYGAENVVMSYQNQKYCDHLSSTVFASSLQFSHNKNLMEIRLPNLKKVLGGYNPFVITGNNGNFANNSKFCCEIRHVLYNPPSNVPYVDRQTCGIFF
ncbi:hypothetical protein L5515_007163 [Caenorhabditis briggsae]|uniref:Receptor L-domain domain-containing protein n=1 Tax=Caenorhabditis briggsae TaxID=6238 RepID=A0AAE9F4D4_CAEBR|nr:hypothetical protein L5515_007163 [Caenorhabditis briggsae]